MITIEAVTVACLQAASDTKQACFLNEQIAHADK